MGRFKNIAAAAACAGLMLAPMAASAQTTPDRNTKVTFSGPVSIPGKTLPAGTYTFKLADSPTNRHIVQIFDKDEMQLMATLLAVPAEKMEAEGDPIITFKETPSNRPPAVHYWYYAGERMGNEFVYPKSQAMSIAQASGEGVMAVDTDSTNIDDWKGTPSRVTATGQDANASSAASTTSTTSSDTTAAQPQQPQSQQPQSQPATTPAATTAQPTTTPETTPQSAAPTTAPQTPAAAPTTAPTTAPSTAPESPVGTSGRATSELPHTASSMPTVGLIGLLAVAGALTIRARRTGLI
jgi:hypothetical protein